MTKNREAKAPRKIRKPFCVVGIGASAGGLDALEHLFGSLGAFPGMAFIVVQHWNPEIQSSLDKILARVSKLSVIQAEDGAPITPNTIYLAPADLYLKVQDEHIRLIEPEPGTPYRMPIDVCFKSLAQAYESHAVGIVLSGAGQDGSEGVRAIKVAGGFTMAQRVAEATHGSMPRNAIATQLIDRVLPANEIAAELLRYSKHPYVAKPKSERESAVTSGDPLAPLFALLRLHTGHDFTHYKRNTLGRRIERRMAVHQIDQMTDYLRYLQQNKNELDDLFKELLINVTSFFRDPDSFEAIKKGVLPRIFSSITSGSAVRMWVPGCASGEEAYSLAMVVSETAEAAGMPCRAQIFATDIDNASLETARVAHYPAAIATDVAPERLARFFDKVESGYRIKKPIRDMVIIAKQDLLQDPPFSRLNMVLCRNLLIYLDQQVQKKILPLFHYTLNPHMFLVLGPSESIGGFTDLFSIVEKKWKIYQRKNAPRLSMDFPTTPLLKGSSEFQQSAGSALGGPMQNLGQLTEKSLLRDYSPPCVIVNEKYDILHFHGRTGEYLEPPDGRANAQRAENGARGNPRRTA